jgi:hypothetical protein
VRVYQFRHIRADAQCSEAFGAGFLAKVLPTGPLTPGAFGRLARPHRPDNATMPRRSRSLRALVLLYEIPFLLFVIGPFAVMLGIGPVGAYLTLVGFALIHLAHRIFGVLVAQQSKLEQWPGGSALAGGGYGVAQLVLLAGLFVGMSGTRAGAYILLGGLAVQFALTLSLGLRTYRASMRRPWPQVAPLADDEW